MTELSSAGRSSDSVKAHLIGLDAVRFLAAAMVMFYHLLFWRNGDLPAPENFFSYSLWFGWVGVQIFFVLSGCVIAFSAKDSTPQRFALSRILRLAPGVWICATISLVVGLVFVSPVDPGLFGRYGQTMIMLPIGTHIDVVYWTLTVEIAFYGLIFLVLWLRGFSAVLPVMLLVGLLSAVYNLAIIVQDSGHGELLPEFSRTLFTWLSKKTFARLLLLPHGIFFALGVLVSALPRNRSKVLWWIATIFFTGVCLGDVYYYAGRYIVEKQLHGVDPWCPALVWFAAFVVLVLSISFNLFLHGISERLNAALRFLGLVTFPLYLLHNTNGLVIERFLVGQGVSPITAFWLTVIIIGAITIEVVVWLEPPLRRVMQGFFNRV